MSMAGRNPKFRRLSLSPSSGNDDIDDGGRENPMISTLDSGNRKGLRNFRHRLRIDTLVSQVDVISLEHRMEGVKGVNATRPPKI
jgi:hypothetical protein